MAATNAVAGIEVLGKVTVGSTPTAFSDQVEVTLNIANRMLEAVTTGTSSFVGRDYEVTDWNVTCRVLQPTTSDAAVAELEAAAVGRTKEVITITEPGSLSTFSGTVLVNMSAGASIGGYYEKTFTLSGDGTLTRS